MNLEKVLRNATAELPVTTGRHTLRLDHNGCALTFTLEHHDAVGCLLWDVRLHRNTPADQKEWATRLAARVTGLLEPLKVHEVDAARGLAFLRSVNPTPRDEARQYYEIELRGTNDLQLARFQGFADPARRREQTTFALTYESLAKLVADLAG